ncbi:hypothetical protein ACLOAV_004482 [Pseudogymnoascus australis]
MSHSMEREMEKNDVSVPSSEVIHDEKDTSRIEGVPVLGPDHPRIKAIKRKTDLRICTLLGVLYMMAAIDRVNLPTLLILVFFPFYITFQAPMIAIARKVGPRYFITFIVISWGLVMVGHGLVESWRTMLALRCLLGIFEAGYFSTAAYLLSTWYIRREVGKRNSYMYLLGSLLGGFGGIIAFGLSQMDGVGGKAGWRWILIMEGIITIAMGIIAYIFIVDFPEKAANTWNFLTEEEVQLVVARINADRNDVVVPPFKLTEYLSHAKDWKIWFFAANFCLTSVINYSVAYFLPIVLRDELGVTEGWLSDKFNLRAPFFLLNCLIEIVGICLLGFAKPSGVRYFGAFLIVGAAFSNIPHSLTYQHNNIVGQWKRAFCSATIVASGGVGGIIGSLVFRSEDAPSYR